MSRGLCPFRNDRLGAWRADRVALPHGVHPHRAGHSTQGPAAQVLQAVKARHPVTDAHRDDLGDEDLRMTWSWKIGRIAGIPIYIHWTFLILIAWLVLSHWSTTHDVAKTVEGVGFVLAV